MWLILNSTTITWTLFFLFEHTHLSSQNVSQILAQAISSTSSIHFIKFICISLQFYVIISIQRQFNFIGRGCVCVNVESESVKENTERLFPKGEVLFWRENHPISCQSLPSSCSKQTGVPFNREFSNQPPLLESSSVRWYDVSDRRPKNNDITVYFTGYRENRGTAVTEQFLVKYTTSLGPH